MSYSINAVARRVVLSGSAGVGAYSFSFEILASSDIEVYLDSTKLTLTTDYAVTINSNGTGSVTLNTGTSNVPNTPTSSNTITIIGSRAIERTTDFVTAGDLKASSLNEQLDSLTIFDQQISERVDRSIKGHITDSTTLDMGLPSVNDRKGKYLAFNATTGAPEAGANSDDVTTLSSITTDIATLADIEDGTDATDAIQTVAGISANTTTVAGISSNVSTVAGISANVTTVAGIQANVTTVAGISSNVTSVAGIASDVTTNASNISAIQGASGNASTATTKASEAATSATKAENYAVKVDGAVESSQYSSKAWAIGGTGVTDTAGSGSAKSWAVEADAVDGTEHSAKSYAISGTAISAGSAKQWALGGGNSFTTGTPVAGGVYSARYYAELAAAAVDGFDDTYLGAKSSDPSTDNDGDALNAGDLYFSTTANKLRVYDGSAWNDAVTDTTGFATNGFAIAMSIAL